MKVRYLSHSCFQIEIDGKLLIIDPFIKPNPLAEAVKFEELKADYILITHGHWDHVADAVELLKQTGATLICQFDLVGWFQKQGVENQAIGLNVGGKVALPFGVVRMVQAVHSSSLPDGSYGGTATGFIIQAEDKTVYYSGDTALFGDMKMFAELYKPQIAFLPVGGNFTMDVDDALIAARWLHVNKVIGMHFDTFPPIQVHNDNAIEHARTQGIDLHLLQINQTIEI